MFWVELHLNRIDRFLQAYRMGRQITGPADDRCPQPKSPLANVIVTSLTRGGLGGNGKGSKGFLPPFLRELRRKGYATYFCTSLSELERMVNRNLNTIVINVFGEDHHNITSERMSRAEAKARLVFNRSEIGSILADKQRSLEHFTKHGVPMPPPPVAGTPVFSNERTGTALPVKIVDTPEQADESRYNRAMIDTVQTFEGRSYYTSVRLMCIADRIVHAMVRARPVEENSPSVHSKDTPLDPELLKSLQAHLINSQMQRYQELAHQMHDALGPCFAAHDVLVESQGDGVFICEAGFKFFDGTFQKHITPIRNDLPFHSLLSDQEEYARKAACLFADWVEAQDISKS